MIRIHVIFGESHFSKFISSKLFLYMTCRLMRFKCVIRFWDILSGKINDHDIPPLVQTDFQSRISNPWAFGPLPEWIDLERSLTRALECALSIEWTLVLDSGCSKIEFSSSCLSKVCYLLAKAILHWRPIKMQKMSYNWPWTKTWPEWNEIDIIFGFVII